MGMQGLSGKTERRMQDIFLKYAGFEASKGKLSGLGARADTVDLKEFFACLTDLGLFKAEGFQANQGPPEGSKPSVMVDKTFITQLFAGIKKGAEEQEKREFSFADFRIAMCTISIALGLTLEDILFPQSVSSEDQVQAKEQHDPEKVKRDIRGLHELKSEHMTALQNVFEKHGGEMDMPDFKSCPHTPLRN
jgi:hypothetical protein